LDCGSPAAALSEAALLRAGFAHRLPDWEKSRLPPIERPPHKEPDSRAVTAKAAAGLPQSKEVFYPLKIFWQGADLSRIVVDIERNAEMLSLQRRGQRMDQSHSPRFPLRPLPLCVSLEFHCTFRHGFFDKKDTPHPNHLKQSVPSVKSVV
jgi:hypothetical protein